MGYCYDSRSGALVCDSCGCSGGVRKRTCPHKVDGLPYCSPPALCKECYKQEGGIRMHDRCKEPAAARQRERYEQQRMLDGGALLVRTAWGSWHDDVPKGFAGVRFEGKDGTSEYRLIPSESYTPPSGVRPLYLHEYDDALPWENHPGVTTKRIG